MAPKCVQAPDEQALPRQSPTPPPQRYSDEVLAALEDARQLNLQAPESRLAEMASTPEGAAKVRRLIEENYFLRSMAKRVTLKPGSGNRMSQWIARHFPTLLARGSDAAKVRNFLEDVGAGGRKLLDTISVTGDSAAGLTSRLLVAPLMENGYKKVRKAIRDGGAHIPKDTIDRMWLDAVELARVPVAHRKVSAGKLTPGAYRTMSNKYDAFLKRVSSYGLGQETVKVLLSEAEEVNKAFEDLHAIGDLAGLDVGDVTNSGISYMPRQFTEDFKFRLRRMDDDVEAAFQKAPALGVDAAFLRSRTTYDLGVEDEFILASVLGLVDSKRIGTLQKQIDNVTDELLRQDLLDELAELRFDATEQLAPLLDDNGALSRELADLPTPVIERLVDSGVLSKVPMTTTEVADRLMREYDLPYSGIDDLLMVDPRAAYNKAKAQLSAQLEKTFALRGMSKDAITNGWGVTPQMARVMPEYASFKPIKPSVLQKAGINPNTVTPLHYHPLVADTIQSMFEVATDPATLGSFAATWQYIWDLSKKQVLTTTGFLGRHVLQLQFTAAMAGTNMAQVIPSIQDWVRFSQRGLDGLSQAPKYTIGGNAYSLRDIVSEGLKRGVLDTGTGVGVDVVLGSLGSQALNPAKIAQAMHNWGSIATGRGALPRVVNGQVRWDFVEYGAGLLKRGTDELASKVMGPAVWLEQAYKLAFIRTKLDLSIGNQMGQFLVGGRPRQYNSLDDIFNEVGDYYLDYGTRGKGDDLIARNVAPFWMYMSRSMPAVYRHMLRHPQQFVLWNRLYSLASEEVRENWNPPEGGLAEWQQGAFGNVYLPHPEDTGDKTRLIHIPFHAIDPIADVLNRTDNVAQSILRVLGFESDSNVKEQLKRIDPTQSQNVLRDTLGQFATGKAIFAALTLEDDRGRSLVQGPDDQWATLLGLPVLGGRFSPLTRYMIENTLPSVANLDRWNPGEVFGVREQRNAAGEVVREAQPSVFGFQREVADSDVDDLRGAYGPTGFLDRVNILRAAGVTLNSIDTAVGMGFTVRDMNRAAKEHKKNFTRISKALEEGAIKGRQATVAYDQMVTHAALYLEIETGKWEGGQWLNARDYLTPNQQKKAANLALKKLKADAKTLNQLNAITRTHGGTPTTPDVDPKTLTQDDVTSPPTRPSQLRALEADPQDVQGLYMDP